MSARKSYARREHEAIREVVAKQESIGLAAIKLVVRVAEKVWGTTS